MSNQPVVSIVPEIAGSPVKTPKWRSPAKPRPLITDRRDGRLAVTKKFDQAVSAITADLGIPADRMTTMQKTMVGAFAGCTVKLDNLTARLLLGEDVDLVEYTVAATALARLSQRLCVQGWDDLKKMEKSCE
jgi:hypothetical protein